MQVVAFDSRPLAIETLCVPNAGLGNVLFSIATTFALALRFNFLPVVPCHVRIPHGLPRFHCEYMVTCCCSVLCDTPTDDYQASILTGSQLRLAHSGRSKLKSSGIYMVRSLLANIQTEVKFHRQGLWCKLPWLPRTTSVSTFTCEYPRQALQLTHGMIGILSTTTTLRRRSTKSRHLLGISTHRGSKAWYPILSSHILESAIQSLGGTQR